MTRHAAWRRSARALGFAAVVLAPRAAQAHASTTGLGPIYDGLAHFATSPADLASVLALALWAGLRGPLHARRVVFVLAGAWMAGGLVGAGAPATGASGAGASLGLLALGALLAADAKLSAGAATILAAGVGLHHGYENGAGLGTALEAAPALAGLGFGVFALCAIASALAVSLRAAWARVALRVLGSWSAAIGLFALGWTLRGR